MQIEGHRLVGAVLFCYPPWRQPIASLPGIGLTSDF